MTTNLHEFRTSYECVASERTNRIDKWKVNIPIDKTKQNKTNRNKINRMKHSYRCLTHTHTYSLSLSLSLSPCVCEIAHYISIRLWRIFNWLTQLNSTRNEKVFYEIENWKYRSSESERRRGRKMDWVWNYPANESTQPTNQLLWRGRKMTDGGKCATIIFHFHFYFGAWKLDLFFFTQ